MCKERRIINKKKLRGMTTKTIKFSWRAKEKQKNCAYNGDDDDDDDDDGDDDDGDDFRLKPFVFLVCFL